MGMLVRITGGMGAFAPSPLMTSVLDTRIRREILEPVLEGMNRDGHPYRGFLYVGLMITADGPQVVEFNVRLGDPEAQVVLPMVCDDLAPLLEAAARGGLGHYLLPADFRSTRWCCTCVGRISRKL